MSIDQDGVMSDGLNRRAKLMIVAVLAGIGAMIALVTMHLSSDRSLPQPAGSASAPASAPHTSCDDGHDCLPDISYVDTTGAKYSRAALDGKIVLVNFWATWCHPCEKEIPDLSKAYDKYKANGVVFLGVMIDGADSQKLLNFQSDHDMSYPVVRADPKLMASYDNPDAYPTTFVYDRKGKRVYTHLGALGEHDLDSLLGSLVAQN